MTSLRHDARHLGDARRLHASVTPTRLTVPAASTAAAAGVAAVALTALGLSSGVVIAAVVLIAAAGAVLNRRTTASLAAGVTLLFARPYLPGERLRLYSPELGRPVEAELVRVGLVNSTLATAFGLLVVANTRLLGSQPDRRDR